MGEGHFGRLGWEARHCQPLFWAKRDNNHGPLDETGLSRGEIEGGGDDDGGVFRGSVEKSGGCEMGRDGFHGLGVREGGCGCCASRHGGIHVD